MQPTGECDNGNRLSYSAIMERHPAHIVLNLDLKDPVEIGDFVSAFTGLASQFDKFMRQNYADIAPHTEIFVREVRKGSIEADLIPIIGVLATIATPMEHVMIVQTFIETYWARLSLYFKPGGRDQTATTSDLRDLMGQVAAIANDPEGKSAIDAVYYEDGKQKKKLMMRFTTKQAKAAVENIEQHRAELERIESADFKRVVMVFKRIDSGDVKVGHPTGERVYINEISHNDLPLIYAADLAEQRIKHEIREANENLFDIGFVVDVRVDYSRLGKPRAYKVTAFHRLIPVPREDDG